MAAALEEWDEHPWFTARDVPLSVFQMSRMEHDSLPCDVRAPDALVSSAADGLGKVSLLGGEDDEKNVEDEVDLVARASERRSRNLSRSRLAGLPEELIAAIVCHLVPEDLARCGFVCSRLRAVCARGRRWLDVFRDTFGERPASKLSERLEEKFPPRPLKPSSSSSSSPTVTARINDPVAEQQRYRFVLQAFASLPRVRTDGVYISRHSYLRGGRREYDTTGNIVHEVLYFRIVRFLPGGRCLYLNTPERPDVAVKSVLRGGDPRVVRGTHSFSIEDGEASITVTLHTAGHQQRQQPSHGHNHSHHSHHGGGDGSGRRKRQQADLNVAHGNVASVVQRMVFSVSMGDKAWRPSLTLASHVVTTSRLSTDPDREFDVVSSEYNHSPPITMYFFRSRGVATARR